MSRVCSACLVQPRCAWRRHARVRTSTAVSGNGSRVSDCGYGCAPKMLSGGSLGAQGSGLSWRARGATAASGAKLRSRQLGEEVSGQRGHVAGSMHSASPPLRRTSTHRTAAEGGGSGWLRSIELQRFIRGESK